MIAEILRGLVLRLFDHVPVKIHVLAHLHHTAPESKALKKLPRVLLRDSHDPRKVFESRGGESRRKKGIENTLFIFVGLAALIRVVPGPHAVFFDDDEAGAHAFIEGRLEHLDIGGGKARAKLFLRDADLQGICLVVLPDEGHDLLLVSAKIILMHICLPDKGRDRLLPEDVPDLLHGWGIFSGEYGQALLPYPLKTAFQYMIRRFLEVRPITEDSVRPSEITGLSLVSGGHDVENPSPAHCLDGIGASQNEPVTGQNDDGCLEDKLHEEFLTRLYLVAFK